MNTPTDVKNTFSWKVFTKWLLIAGIVNIAIITLDPWMLNLLTAS